MPKKETGILPILLILLQSLLYGFGDPITKKAYRVMPVFSLLAVRYMIAFAVLILLFGKRVRQNLRAVPVKDWLLPSVCIGLTYILNNLALKLTAATSVAFLRSLSTVITPLMAFILFRDSFDRRHIVIHLAVVVGLYLLCGYGGLNGFGVGEALTLTAACFMAGALVFGALFASMLFDGGVRIGQATPKVWAIILYLALACTLTGYLLQNLALEKIPARAVSLIQCTCPVMTAVFSFLLLGERLAAVGMIGAVIILFCVAGESVFGSKP